MRSSENFKYLHFFLFKIDLLIFSDTFEFLQNFLTFFKIVFSKKIQIYNRETISSMTFFQFKKEIPKRKDFS